MNTIDDTILSLSEIADLDSEQLLPGIPLQEDDSDDFPSGTRAQLPLLPIRNTVLFPGVIIPITVGRKKSIKLIKKVQRSDKTLGVVTQKNPQHDDPGFEDLFHTGTVAKILKMIKLPDGNTTLVIQGKKKFQIEELVSEDPYLIGEVTFVEESFPKANSKEGKAFIDSLKESAMKIIKLNPEIPSEAQMALESIESPAFLTHFLSSNINAEVQEKQEMLEMLDGAAQATRLLGYMLREIQLLEIKQEIHEKVSSDIDQQQRDYFLRQQMKVLQDELGVDGPDQEVESLKVKARKAKLPQHVAEHFEKELKKLQHLNPAAPDYPVQINYCEFLVELPWSKFTKDNFDLKKAQKILDKAHYGLEKVKDRIIEYLAVLKLKNDLRGPILCLYGPPGVGKTSLGKSIAQALGRKYVRMSLGGLKDEAEIRGHRKTYVGAMPGRILQNIKKADSSNPVFILDEIDKISSDFRGDPASALLEVLDPEQNNAFSDNYLEMEYDLSKVLFIATANSLDTLHPALLDRMEIIEINGYSLEEKVEIAKKHLIPKQRKEHGLNGKQLSLDTNALKHIIEAYTRESGVRSLERKIGAVARYAAKSVVLEEDYSPKIKQEHLSQVLGAPLFDKEVYQQNDIAGIVTGLAWTPVGGEILSIESSLSRGKGKITLSGQLGDVMKESASTALSYLKTQADTLGIDYRIFERYDLHIHVPAGAVPKDGPSAGITLLVSLASVFTQRKVQPKIAMTGEITLSGRVLPVGGIKEKLLAARRAGIREVILSEKNRKDVEELKAEYLKTFSVHFVQHAREVLSIALHSQKVNMPLQFQLED